jgi:hypothetical protein
LRPNDPVCRHCGSMSGKHYDLAKTRIGLGKRSDRRKQFAVKVGTVFASAHIHKALQPIHLMCGQSRVVSLSPHTPGAARRFTRADRRLQ